MMRSIASQAAGAALNAAIGFALLVFLGRTLAPEAFAYYVALLSAAVVALIAIAGGNPLLLYREGVSATPASVQSQVALAVTQALTTTALLGGAAFALEGSPALLAILCMGALALAEFVSAQLRAQGRFAREAGWQIAVRVATALAIVAAVLLYARDATSIFLAWLLSAAAMLLLFARRYLAWPQVDGLRAHLALVAPIVLVNALVALATKGDAAVLATRFTPRELADYAVCTRFTDAALLAFAPVSNVQMRYLGLRRADPQEFARTWRRAAALGLALGTLALVASVLAGEAVVAVTFGAHYDTSGRLLAWVATGLPFLLANLVLVQAMVAAGRERQLAGVLVVGVAGWLAALLIGARYGLPMAALGGALVHAAMAATLALLLRRRRAA